MSGQELNPTSSSAETDLERLLSERANRLERLTARAQALAEASRAFSEVAHRIDAALEIVVRKTAELVREACTISLVSDDRQTIKMVAYHHIDPGANEATKELLSDVELRMGDSIIGKVASTGQPFWVEDVSAEDLRKTVHPRFRSFLEVVSLRGMLCVPLCARDEIIGTLTIARGPAGGRFTSEDKDFLEDLAARAALAIANGRMFQRLQTELQERARAEEALRRSEEQLRQSQKMEAVGRLAGGIAHDFNNALSAILGSAEFARRSLDAAHPAAQDLEVISQAGHHAAVLTRQLLVFSRNHVLQTKRLNLNDVIRNLEPMLRRLLPQDIQIVSAMAPRLAAIEADAGQIEQVVVNLAVNARDAMPDGGRLTIETTNIILDDDHALEHLSLKAGPHVILAVSDTGHGMDADTMSHVFEPFFTTKKAGQGTGLGLATVYGIVKQSGGHIWVSSELQHGASFKVYFPASAVVEPITAPESRPARKTSGAETILLVEDEPLVRRVARRILEQAGHRVLEADGAEEAAHASQTYVGQIDLLITDVILSGANGRDVAEVVRAMRPDLKVLFMSGYTGDSIAGRRMLDPGSILLEKPFTPESVMQKVREVLERS